MIAIRINIVFSLLAPACVFLCRKNFLCHYLHMHYFWAVLYNDYDNDDYDDDDDDDDDNYTYW